MSDDVRRVGDTFMCHAEVSEGVAQTAALAAGIASEEEDRPVRVIVPVEHEQVVVAHLDGWGFHGSVEATEGPMMAILVSPKGSACSVAPDRPSALAVGSGSGPQPG